MPTILRDFFAYLLNQPTPAGRRRLSQSEIARRSEISQSVVNKIMMGGVGITEVETYKRVANGFRREWDEFFRVHADVRTRLFGDFEWLLRLAPLQLGPRSQSPIARDAHRELEAIAEAGDEGRLRLALQQLRLVRGVLGSSGESGTDELPGPLGTGAARERRPRPVRTGKGVAPKEAPHRSSRSASG